MNEEHQLGENSCPYSWLNEWLCEYVDGTMDPSLRRVFEKYVEANPDLKDHIKRLRHTRQLLCQCSGPAQQEAPDAVRARVREKVECDMLRTPHSLHEAVKERPVAAFVSSFVVALVVGVFAGAALFAPGTVSTQSPTADTRSLWLNDDAEMQRAVQPLRTQTAMPNTATQRALPFLMEHNMGAPYTVDSTSAAMTWHTPIQP